MRTLNPTCGCQFMAAAVDWLLKQSETIRLVSEITGLSTLEISVSQLCSVTEIAPKSLFLCLNRKKILHDFINCCFKMMSSSNEVKPLSASGENLFAREYFFSSKIMIRFISKKERMKNNERTKSRLIAWPIFLFS